MINYKCIYVSIFKLFVEKCNSKYSLPVKRLFTSIEDSEQADLLDSNKQNEFLENAFYTFKELYKTHLNKSLMLRTLRD